MKKLFLKQTAQKGTAMLLLAGLCFSFAACGGKSAGKTTGKEEATKEPQNAAIGEITVPSMLTAVSDTGVSVSLPAQKADSEKQVGIFYFIWQGTDVGASYPHIYNSPEILSKIDLNGRTSISLAEWQAAGGGSFGTWHWWGEPLFGYYDMLDEWVITRHVEMLTDAGIDYIVIDQTNGVRDGYIKRINLLFSVLDKYSKQGYDVPKVTMMTYDEGGTVNKLYAQFYAKHPEYEYLFYHWNNHEKPMIIDNISGMKRSTGTLIEDTESQMAAYSEKAREYFDFMDLTFPIQTRSEDLGAGNGFMYMDFRENPEPVVNEADGGYSFCCVSVAEISGTNWSSEQWFSNTTDRTRSWDGTQNRNWLPGEEDAYLYGYNFKRQFEYAISKNVNNIFITGWNEWMAQLQNRSGTIALCDNADINNSRDIEPMKGGYGDNYYLQMCDLISRFKYGTVKQQETASHAIDVNGDFTQWQQDGILSFADYGDDTLARDQDAACNWTIHYSQEEGLNDIQKVKVASDAENLYFYVKTAEAIRDRQQEGRMTVFLNLGSEKNWYGFDYAVNRTGGAAAVEKCKGGWDWEKVGTATCKAEGDQMMIAIPRALLGLSAEGFTLSFKVADGYKPDDIWSFYVDGDCAPYGRMAYTYKSK